MARRALFVVGGLSGLLGIWACSSHSSDGSGANDGTLPGDDGGSNAVTGSQDSSLGDGGTPQQQADGAPVSSGSGPLAGIAAVQEVAPSTEAPGGYFDSVRQWYDAGLIFADPTSGGGGGIVFQYANGAASPYRTPSNQSLGSAIDNHRSLVTAESNVGGAMYGRVVRTLSDGGYSVIADSWDAGGVGVQFDSPNDLTVRKSDGTIYVTDPGYQDPDAGINHVFRIDPTGTARVADSCDNLCRPNGIALSPDEKTLYVSFSGPFSDKSSPYIGAYPINADGSLGALAHFVDVGANIDGLATDDNGNVYAAYNDGVAAFDKSGTKWGVIAVPKQPTGIAFGDADRRTLYISAVNAQGPSIYSVKLNVAGRVE